MGNLILVIDDSLTVRKILEASLQRERFQAASFRDGLQAMQALASGALPIPDAILIDVHLPRVDGFELVRRFRHHAAFDQVPILMLSGSTGWIQKLKAWRAGADGYLTKPFRTQMIMDELRCRLNGRAPAHARERHNSSLYS